MAVTFQDALDPCPGLRREFRFRIAGRSESLFRVTACRSTNPPQILLEPGTKAAHPQMQPQPDPLPDRQLAVQ